MGAAWVGLLAPVKAPEVERLLWRLRLSLFNVRPGYVAPAALPEYRRSPGSCSRRRQHPFRNALPQQRLLRCDQLRAIVTAREQMAVCVGGHLNRGVPKRGLHEVRAYLLGFQ